MGMFNGFCPHLQSNIQNSYSNQITIDRLSVDDNGDIYVVGFMLGDVTVGPNVIYLRPPVVLLFAD